MQKFLKEGGVALGGYVRRVKVCELRVIALGLEEVRC